MSASMPCRVRRLGRVDYTDTLARMHAFTETRAARTLDEIWLLEHPPVYTLGLRARHRTIAAGDVPVVVTDRGGDVTYHGPGQAIVYLLLDLQRRRLGIHELVRALELSAIAMLAELGISAARRPSAPGVYVGERKIAALGLRVRAGRSYHGLALNAAMDLRPFAAIDPCGYPGLKVTQIAELRPDFTAEIVGERLLHEVLAHLAYTELSASIGKPGARFDEHDARR